MWNFVKSFMKIHLDGIMTNFLRFSANIVSITNQLGDWAFSEWGTKLFGMKKVSHN